MEEFLAVVVLIICVIIYITILSSRKKTNQKIEELSDDLTRKMRILLDNQFELDNLVRQGEVRPQKTPPKKQTPQKEEEKIIAPPPPVDEEVLTVDPSDNYPQKEETEKIEIEKNKEERKKEPVKEEITKTIITDKKQNEKKSEPKQTKQPFLKRYPNLEEFIGENLINKIGILVFVLGLAFFVKYAIDENWINEIGRVAIGIAVGGGLVAIAHKLRTNYASFSSVLIGGGLAVMYFTISLAFHEYHLFSQSVTFVIMILITAFAVMLSIAYNRQELAVLAILGGFATPLMVSTGSGNYKILFSYILILDVGMLVLAYFKKWNLLNFISFLCTVILYASWLTIDYLEKGDEMPFLGALIFATLFYLVFFAMNIINNLKERKKFKGIEISMLISNSFLYFAAGLFLLYHYNQLLQGIFTAALAVFNFIFALLLYKRVNVDKNFVYLLIGLVLTFISLVAPIQLEGNSITLFWAAEAALLIWMGIKTQIKLIKITGMLVWIVMLISLAMDWHNNYFSYIEPEEKILSVILNQVFLTGIAAIASLAISLSVIKYQSEEKFLYQLPKKAIQNILTFSLLIVLYFTLFFEISYQYQQLYESHAALNVITGVYNLIFILGVQIWTKLSNKKILFAYILGVIGIFTTITFYQPEFIFLRDKILLGEIDPIMPYKLHWGLFFLSIAVISMNIIISPGIFKSQNIYLKLMRWINTFFVLFILCIELDHIVLITNYTNDAFNPQTMDAWEYFHNTKSHILEQTHRIGWPILWGISSFVLIIVGLQKQIKDLRVIALVVFTITLVKLFAFDVWEMEEAGRIAAFILLGIILLVVSFMYQKLKKLLLDDKEKEENNKEVNN